MKRGLVPYNVMRYAEFDFAPKGPAVATFIGSAIFGGGVLTATQFAVASFILKVGLTAVTSWALQALAPKPKFGGLTSAGLLVNDRNGIAPQDFIYGEVRKGGTVVYDETTGANNKFLHRVIALAGHEVEEIGDIYINDEVVTLDTLFDYQVTVDYTNPGGNEGTPTSESIVVNFSGVKRTDAIYNSSQSLTYNQLLDLDAKALSNDLGMSVATFFNSFFREFDGATVNSKTQAGGGFVVDGPYANKIRIKKHLGDQTTADADLLAESGQIDSNFVGNGIAYIYARFEYDRDVFANGLPLITAKIKGKKVFDPRTSATAYSNNAALCLRDFLQASYGLQDSDIDEAAFQIAANECDEAVALAAGGTEPKYTMNGVVRADQNFGDVLQQMTTCCTGTLFWGMGAWDLVAGAYSAPVLNFGLEDLRGPMSVDPLTNLRDAFNAVSGTFNDADQDYITVDYPTITSSVFEAEDGGERLLLDLELPFTTSATAAQRIAKLTLLRSREQISMSADFSLKAFNVEVGDIITFTNEQYGWDQKQFEVVGWNLNIGESAGISVRLDLQETSEAAYDWNAEETVIIANNSSLPSIYTGLEINNLSASGGGRTQKDGTFVNTAILSWDEAGSSFVNQYEVQWRPTFDSSYSTTVTSDTSVEISPIADGIEYLFRVRSITDLGNRGPFSSVFFTGGGDVTAPSLPTAITATGGFKYITVDWTNPADTDLNYIEVWENSTNTTSGATLVGEIWGNQFVRTNLGISETKYYFLRAVDYSGNTSGYTAGVSATTTFIDDPDFENGIRSLFEEQGLYPIEDVDGLPPSGILNRKVFNRQDGKLYEWNGSAWVLVVSAVEAPDIDGQLTDAQIADLDAAKLTGEITETQISDDAISTPKLQAGAITTAKIAAAAVTADEIAANSITSAKIAANTITANDIATGTITASEIAGNTITGDKIVANTITGGLLATSGIITSSAQIDDALITSAKIENAAITTAKIDDLAVDTIKIGNNAVTIPSFVFADYGGTVWSSSFVTAISATISRVGVPTFISISGSTDGITGVETSYRINLLKNGSLIRSFDTSSLGRKAFSLVHDDSATDTGNVNYSVDIAIINGAAGRIYEIGMHLTQFRR